MMKGTAKTDPSLFRSDDDTFFPDFEATVRMLAEQGSSAKPSLVGALSESTKQVSAAELAASIPAHLPLFYRSLNGVTSLTEEPVSSSTVLSWLS